MCTEHFSYKTLTNKSAQDTFQTNTLQVYVYNAAEMAGANDTGVGPLVCQCLAAEITRANDTRMCVIPWQPK